MPHPKYVRYCEGTYVQKNKLTGKYVYLSEYIHPGDDLEVLRDHDAIADKLSEYGITDDLDFDSTLDPEIVSAFLEA